MRTPHRMPKFEYTEIKWESWPNFYTKCFDFLKPYLDKSDMDNLHSDFLAYWGHGIDYYEFYTKFIEPLMDSVAPEGLIFVPLGKDKFGFVCDFDKNHPAVLEDRRKFEYQIRDVNSYSA